MVESEKTGIFYIDPSMVDMIPISEIKPYKRNAKKHPQEQIEQIINSIKAFGMNDPIGVWGKSNIIVEGHGRYLALREMGESGNVPVIHLDNLTDEQRKAYALAHNKLTMNTDFDFGTLESELDALQDYFDMADFGFEELEKAVNDWFDREKEGKAKQEGNDEYNEFLDKFEAKKTTDDCYTPDNIYRAVANWVAKRYSLDSSKFIRPFFPGGDYQAQRYPHGSVVVDNPPFSIMSEIINFYLDRKIGFFLFAPSLATFNYLNRPGVTAVGEYSDITYENGAVVKTSFLTNLEGDEIAAFSDFALFEAIEAANEENEKAMHVSLPKYEYPNEVITAAKMGWLIQYGQELTIKRKDSVQIRALDAQKEQGKAIFGCGLLLSERAAAERAAAERAAATKWKLSEREWEIVRSLGK